LLLLLLLEGSESVRTAETTQASCPGLLPDEHINSTAVILEGNASNFSFFLILKQSFRAKKV